MRLLLDSHVFLWYVSSDGRLSARAREAIEDPSSMAMVRLVTMWEVAIKHAKGRIGLDEAPDVFFANGILQNRFEYLPLRPAHVYRAAALPVGDHRDPFDRALVGQALVERLTLVSADAKLDRYHVPRLF